MTTTKHSTISTDIAVLSVPVPIHARPDQLALPWKKKTQIFMPLFASQESDDLLIAVQLMHCNRRSDIVVVFVCATDLLYQAWRCNMGRF